jgi:hypothetical protein
LRAVLPCVRIVTYLCTNLYFGFGIMQFPHRICDIGSIDDCVTVEHAACAPSADLHYHGLAYSGPPQIARRSPAEIVKD